MALSNDDIDAFFTDPRFGTKIKAYGGCLLQTELEDMTPEPHKFYVINFLRQQDPADEIGHWVAVWNMRPSYILYVDPFGQPPPETILAFMKRARKTNGERKNVIFSTTDLQDLNSDFCGHFVLIIIKELMKGQSLLTILSDFDLLNTKLNDMLVKRLMRDRYFATVDGHQPNIV
jgi:hypothetical protein